MYKAITAAKFLEVYSSTVTRWALAGQIPAIKKDRAWYFDKSELAKFIATNTHYLDRFRSCDISKKLEYAYIVLWEAVEKYLKEDCKMVWFPNQLSLVLGVPQPRILDWIETHQLEATKKKRVYYIQEDDLVRFLREHPEYVGRIYCEDIPGIITECRQRLVERLEDM